MRKRLRRTLAVALVGAASAATTGHLRGLQSSLAHSHPELRVLHRAVPGKHQRPRPGPDQLGINYGIYKAFSPSEQFQ